MKNSRKIKKRFLALLGCAALGAVLAPAALAAEDLAAPAAGDPFRQYLPLIIGVWRRPVWSSPPLCWFPLPRKNGSNPVKRVLPLMRTTLRMTAIRKGCK